MLIYRVAVPSAHPLLGHPRAAFALLTEAIRYARDLSCAHVDAVVYHHASSGRLVVDDWFRRGDRPHDGALRTCGILPSELRERLEAGLAAAAAMDREEEDGRQLAMPFGRPLGLHVS